jgi:uncharacterized protein YbjT (DUF2867 family)
LVQPIAAADVAEVLAEIATGAPQGRIIDLAGPEPQDLVDMARAHPGGPRRIDLPDPELASGLFGVDAAGEVLLPGPEARFRTDHVRRLAQSAERDCTIALTI